MKKGSMGMGEGGMGKDGEEEYGNGGGRHEEGKYGDGDREYGDGDGDEDGEYRDGGERDGEGEYGDGEYGCYVSTRRLPDLGDGVLRISLVQKTSAFFKQRWASKQ